MDEKITLCEYTNKSFMFYPYCSLKITKVLNNNGASYAIVVRFSAIQSGQLVELRYKTVMDEIITLCEYTTQSFMFYPYCSLKITKVLNVYVCM